MDMERLFAVIIGEVLDLRKKTAPLGADEILAAPYRTGRRAGKSPQKAGPEADPWRKIMSMRPVPPELLHQQLQRHALPGKVLRKLLGLAWRVEQRGLSWRTVSFDMMSGSEFITVTTHLEAVPWILLDLRGRLQPLLLRIGVGIGGLDAHFKQPAKNLTGECARLARRALDELRGEDEFAGANASAGAQRRGGSGRRGRKSRLALPPLTRFRSVSFDFDDDVNWFYARQNPVIHKMRLADWHALLPDWAVQPAASLAVAQADSASMPAASANGGEEFDGLEDEGLDDEMEAGVARPFAGEEVYGFDALPGEYEPPFSTTVIRPAWLGKTGERKSPCRGRGRGFVHAPVVAPGKAPQPRSRRDYFSELMAAASGIEQLIGERFYAVLRERTARRTLYERAAGVDAMP